MQEVRHFKLSHQAFPAHYQVSFIAKGRKENQHFWGPNALSNSFLFIFFFFFVKELMSYTDENHDDMQALREARYDQQQVYPQQRTLFSLFYKRLPL